MSDTMARTGQPPAGRRPAAAGQSAPITSRPFVAGTRRIDQTDYDRQTTMTTGSQDLPTWEIAPNGYLAGIYLNVDVAAASNAATVAFAADGPFNVISSITLQDTNSQPLVGPMSGWDLYCIGKYGGYHFVDDAKLSPSYSVTTGVGGGLGGSFSFILFIPIELVRRDAVGALPNKNASATLSVLLSLNSTTNVYTTPPTNPPTVRVRGTLVGWQDPNQSDIRGNPVAQVPPGVNSTQYWNRQTYTLTSGAMDQRLQAIDSMLRNLIIVARDENSSRAQGDTEFPDPFSLQYENSMIAQNRIRALWRHWIAQRYGYTAAVETAGGRDHGVYPFDWMQDFGFKPGNEQRLTYLPMSSASNLTMRGTIGGTGANLYTILVNKVVPANGNPLELTGGR